MVIWLCFSFLFSEVLDTARDLTSEIARQKKEDEGSSPHTTAVQRGMRPPPAHN
jgi:hypothetical protein